MEADVEWSVLLSSTRSASPSPSTSPSRALASSPDTSRCLSSPPTLLSSTSSRSVSSASDSGIPAARRRGYVRPQGTTFSASAKNRDSVMSLGSIAHMQYYFARTGLLDGRGAQYAKGSSPLSKIGLQGDLEIGSEADNFSRVDEQGKDWGKEGIDYPVLSLDSFNEDAEADADMLPPTVSTYRVKPIKAAPPPDIAKLRTDLKKALDTARKSLTEITTDHLDRTSTDDMSSSSHGWHEIQGLHILDVVTLAIRSAKDYYTFHPSPQILYSVKSERSIRNDLHQALDILKRMANRNFRDGLRTEECTGLLHWLDSITSLLRQERDMLTAEEARRSTWIWLKGDWTGREREREHLFLASFISPSVSLPPWETTKDSPTPFLHAMSTGLILIQLHNEFVYQSSRHFGAITTFHTDLGKPYRCAENLRFWTKAAELRWQVRLQVDVLDIVYARGTETWNKFEQAILQWTRAVRQELTTEWGAIPSRPGTSAGRSRAGTQTDWLDTSGLGMPQDA